MERRTSTDVSIQIPTVEQIKEAQRRFHKHEPRDLFYRVSSELIELALAGKTNTTIAEALSVLLQTWNRPYYQFRPFTEEHFCEIEHLLQRHLKQALAFRIRTINSTTETDLGAIEPLFGNFEQVLGPVGAAKSLHLLAPNFFPLWDRDIAKRYGRVINGVGTNGANYVAFFLLTLQQVRALLPMMDGERALLKRIDEYSYCKYTKAWL